MPVPISAASPPRGPASFWPMSTATSSATAIWRGTPRRNSKRSKPNWSNCAAKTNGFAPKTRRFISDSSSRTAVSPPPTRAALRAPRGRPSLRTSPLESQSLRITWTRPSTCRPRKTAPTAVARQLLPCEQQHVCRQEDIVLAATNPRDRFRSRHRALSPMPPTGLPNRVPANCATAQIGPVTKAVAVFLRHEVKLSYRDIRKVFAGVFGMPFVPASAMNFDRKDRGPGPAPA